MNIQHFTEMPKMQFKDFQKMLEIHCIKMLEIKIRYLTLVGPYVFIIY